MPSKWNEFRQTEQTSTSRSAHFSEPRENGAVLVIVAICAALLVLLCVGVTIQSPTNNANVTRAQHAVSVSAAEAIHSIVRPIQAAEHAYTVSRQIMNNEYDSSQSGFFSPGFDSFYVLIPAPGPPAITPPAAFSGVCQPDITDFLRYYCEQDLVALGSHCISCTASLNPACNDAGITSRQLEIARRVFDLSNCSDTRIDDEVNGIMVFAQTTPIDYLGFLPGFTQEVAATVLDRPQAAYLLIDPALSAGNENYFTLFGELDGSPGVDDAHRFIETTTPMSEEQWPVSWNRGDPSMPFDVGPLWTHPTGPTTGAFSSFTPLGVAHGQENLNLYRFFSSMCYALPWDYYKGAVVDVLDFMASHASFTNTSMVGLTGLGPVISSQPPLVPLHPIDALTNPAVHKLEMPTANALSDPYTDAYRGFINTSDPAKHANNPNELAVPGTDPWADSGDEIGSGYNDWSLCLCRAGLIDNAGPDQYSQTNDTESVRPSLNPNVNHESEGTRIRATPALQHWCSDAALPAPNNNAVNFSQARSATGGGETVRNLVSTLGIRFFDLRLDRLDDPAEADGWSRGTPSQQGLPGALYPPSASAYNPMQTGWRYLPDSIRAACSQLKTSVDDYQSKGYLQAERPIDDKGKSLVLFGFGPWSTTATSYVIETNGLAGNLNPELDAWDIMTDDFLDALGNCSCDLNTRVVLAFLPLNEKDRLALMHLKNNGLEAYVDYENYQCGGPIVPLPSGCASAADLRIDLFAVDYTLKIFWANQAAVSFLSLTPNEVAQTKVNAAKFFRENIPIAIRRLLKRFIYQI